MNIENKLRELLLPVLGLKTVDEIKPEYACFASLGIGQIASKLSIIFNSKGGNCK